MSRFKKILLGSVATLVLIGLGLVVYVEMNWDKQWDVPLPNLKASTDPEVIARGQYLVHGPAHCSNCHVGTFAEMQQADAGEALPLAGGAVFPMGPLGKLAPSNLTSDPETGLARYSDGQIFRMMRHAIKPDGTATISLVMPFWNMADEDLVAIVSYLRTLDPVRRETPAPEWTFLGKVMRVFLPPMQPILDPTPPDHAPPMEATPERGEYVARYVANCFACHTKHDEATAEQTGPSWAGGSEFQPMPFPGHDPNVYTRSPNLTPHPSGVLKNYPTAEAWIARFRRGRTVATSPMHWGPFSRMSDEDLTALWMFFNTLDPIASDAGAMVFDVSEREG